MALSDKEKNINILPKNWSIEEAGWRDYTQLSRLERACFHPGDIWPFWDLIGVLTLPGVVRFKVVIDDRMVGFIAGERKSSRRIGWVTTLAVLPSYRRHGIASALLEKCEQTLDTRVVRLSVRASNAGAIALYESAGYIVVNRWKKYYVGGEDGLVFEKRMA